MMKKGGGCRGRSSKPYLHTIKYAVRKVPGERFSSNTWRQRLVTGNFDVGPEYVEDDIHLVRTHPDDTEEAVQVRFAYFFHTRTWQVFDVDPPWHWRWAEEILEERPALVKAMIEAMPWIRKKME